jgi:hypothetical protein
MTSCTICMKEELDNEDIYTTNCNHFFCKECLDDWFKRGNQTCPLCRSEIDNYTYKEEKYKLIIHTIETEINTNQTNQINLSDLIINNSFVRNIIKKNIRLRFYSFSISLIFLYYLNQYLYLSSTNNEISSELNICNLNITYLQDSLKQCQIMIPNADYNGPGYYLNMFNGEFTRRCFYPLNFYNICFNK